MGIATFPRFEDLSMIIRAFCASLLAATAITGTASAAELHATTDGLGDCTTEFEACSLETAISTAVANDRVLLHPGVHMISTTVTEASAGVQLVASPDEARPVIDATGGRLVLQNGSSLTGVDVVSTTGTALESDGLLDHLRVSVTGTLTTAVQLDSGATLRNSSVMASGTGAVGVRVAAEDSPAELRGVTVISSGGAASALDVGPLAPDTSSSVTAVNSIFSGAGGSMEVRVHAAHDETATATLLHCATTPSRQVTLGPGATLDTSVGAMTLPPVFMDRASGDLRQQVSSPTIDAGTPTPDLSLDGASDLDGTARQLGTPDIGADEREMPPVLLETKPLFNGRTVSLQVTVQPRGQTTDVAADWGTTANMTHRSASTQVSGNAPVVVTLPIGTADAAVTSLSARTTATNPAGTVTGATQLLTFPAIPPLPGARPVLLSKRSSYQSGMFTFRLWCHHTISCRGSVFLTGIGTVSPAAFKIPFNQVRTVRLQLSSKQTRRVRRAGHEGLKAQLEIRSTQDGSSLNKVRLVGRKSAKS